MSMQCDFCQEKLIVTINSLRKTFITVFIISIIYEIYCMYDYIVVLINHDYKFTIGNIIHPSMIRIGEALIIAGIFTILRYMMLRNELCELCFTPIKKHIKINKKLVQVSGVVFGLSCIYELYSLSQLNRLSLHSFILRIEEAVFITGIVAMLYYKTKIKNRHD